MSPEYATHPDIVYPRIVVPVQYESRKVWLLRTLDNEENRRAMSGLIYEDDIDSQYSYSDQVPNCKQLSVGDLVLLRDNKILLGAAVIQSIDVEDTSVERLECPVCGSAKMYWRKSKNDWRCDGKCLKRDGLSGDARSTRIPVRTMRDSVSYTAKYGDTWFDLCGSMLAKELPTLSDRWNAQNSIVQLNPTKVLNFFDSLHFSMREEIDLASDSHLIAHGGFDERVIRSRRGQTQFRGHLISRFGATCAFTGPCYFAALDAAHLYSYAEVGEHREGGGLLLRRDLHTLFDRGFIGVDNCQKIVLHRDLRRTQYASLQEQNLKVPVGNKEIAFLEEHYDTFHENFERQ